MNLTCQEIRHAFTIHSVLMPFVSADSLMPEIATTGNLRLDQCLGGGLEVGLMHLVYGDSILRDDLHRIAVSLLLPKSQGGLDSPVIIIDSNNILRIDMLTEIAFHVGLKPEDVMNRIYISRAFNSSQTYDLVINQLDDFFDDLNAGALLLPGLVDIYHREGLSAEAMQQITHMTNRLMAFSLRREVVTVVSTGPSQRNPSNPLGGQALKSCSQIHVLVEETPMRVNYSLMKHPSYTFQVISKLKSKRFASTLPLQHFIEDWEE
ncbi:MAG: hypothetical protein ACXABF_09105 [Candidatus Thorarchaeota archaeon]